MRELTWYWVYTPYLDEPDKQAESALKAGYNKVVFKAEADEVIAALHDKLRQQSIFLGNYKLMLHSKVGFDKDPTETLRHNKYKRCLFMAEYYSNEVRYLENYMSLCGGYDSYVNASINKLKKRLAIWTKLMNNFKEYK